MKDSTLLLIGGIVVIAFGVFALSPERDPVVPPPEPKRPKSDGGFAIGFNEDQGLNLRVPSDTFTDFFDSIF